MAASVTQQQFDQALKALEDACRVGDLPKIQAALADGAQVWRHDFYVLEILAKNNHLPVIQWFIEYCNEPIPLNARKNVLLRSAVENGHLELFRWLLEESQAAASRNPTWNQLTQRPNLAPRSQLGAFFRQAIIKDQTEIAKYILVTYANDFDFTMKIDETLRRADKLGHSVMIDWLLNSSGHLAAFLKAGVNDRLIAKYVSSGQKAVVEFIDLQSVTQLTRLRDELQKAEDRFQKMKETCAASVTCQKAVLSGVVRTLADLQPLLEADMKPSRGRKL